MKKHLLLAALCLGLMSLGANAQVSPSTSSDQNNPAGTPGTPPTFPTDQQAPAHPHDTDADHPEDQAPSATTPSGSSVGTPTDSQSTTGANSSATTPQTDNTASPAPDSGSQSSTTPNGSQSMPNHSTPDNSSTTPDSTSGSATSAAGADVQSQIQSALQQQGLANVNVNVSDQSIDLSGTVETGKDKQTAKRIANSYANGRKVKDNLTVSGKGK
jgi:hypothetical protein